MDYGKSGKQNHANLTSGTFQQILLLIKTFIAATSAKLNTFTFSLNHRRRELILVSWRVPLVVAFSFFAPKFWDVAVTYKWYLVIL